MKDIPRFPYFPIQFDKNGQRAAQGDAEFKALATHLGHGQTTDLIVISHGWNNDMDEAQGLYEELLSNAGKLIDEGKFPGVAQRKFAVLGVLWPSKKFADKELIPSGAAGVASAVELNELREKIQALRDVFDAPDANAKLDQMRQLLPKLEDSDRACRQFVELARSLVSVSSPDDEDGSRTFLAAQPLDVFEAMKQPISYLANTVPEIQTGGATGFEAGGEAAGLGDVFSGVLSGARNLLNYTTYYQMKARAGLVGSTGVNPLLQAVRAQQAALRLHLVGHSFGGRLVTATVAGADDGGLLTASSMSLLQAAFSHYGFAKNWDDHGSTGFFRRIVEKDAISGPIVITCTQNDKAVGLAYPIASLLAGQTASGLGDKDSKYGGLGRNGAQKSDAIELKMVAVGVPYALRAQRINNLNADSFIKNHGDVSSQEVAYLVLSAIAAS
jgi:hypothetical protein